VEVLTDGASALYGSDAIAGVVNIITRKNFDGGEASVYVGQYGEGDGQKRSYSATFGKTFDRGWFSVGAERTKEDEMLGSEREFSRYPTARATRRHLNGNTQWARHRRWQVLTVGPGGDPSQKGNFHAPDPADGANTKTNMSLLSRPGAHSVFANGGFSITDDRASWPTRCTASASRPSTWPATPRSAPRRRATAPCRPVQGQRVQPLGPGRAVLAPHREVPRGTENNLDQARQHRPGRQLRNRFAVLGLERQLHVQPQ
jgi:iron complex outermembrane receptor protein